MHITPRCKEHDVNLVGEVYKDNSGLVAFYQDEDIDEGQTSTKGFSIDLSYHYCPVGQVVIGRGQVLADEDDCADSWYFVIETDA